MDLVPIQFNWGCRAGLRPDLEVYRFCFARGMISTGSIHYLVQFYRDTGAVSPMCWRYYSVTVVQTFRASGVLMT